MKACSYPQHPTSIGRGIHCFDRIVEQVRDHQPQLTLMAVHERHFGRKFGVGRNATILQLSVPDSLRGRLSALHIMVVTGGPRLGDFEAGVLPFGEKTRALKDCGAKFLSDTAARRQARALARTSRRRSALLRAEARAVLG